MFRRCRFLFILAMSTLWAVNSHAQTFQIGGTGSNQMSMPRYPMLFSKPVQQELKIGDEQFKKIKDKVKELTPDGSFIPPPSETRNDSGESSAPKVSFGIMIKGADGAPPVVAGSGPIKFDPSMMGKLPDFKKIDEEVDKLLEQPQKNRLQQIVLQRQGLSAIARDEVAKEIGLENEQKELVKQIMEEQRKKTQEMLQQALADGSFQQQDKMSGMFKKQREQTEQDLSILLTPEQLAKWEELQGPKFEGKAK